MSESSPSVSGSQPGTSTSDGSGESWTCSICQSDFNVELEGGIVGDLGILPTAFCPTCLAGIMDLAEQLRGSVECPKCGEVFDGSPDQDMSRE